MAQRNAHPTKKGPGRRHKSGRRLVAKAAIGARQFRKVNKLARRLEREAAARAA